MPRGVGASVLSGITLTKLADAHAAHVITRLACHTLYPGDCYSTACVKQHWLHVMLAAALCALQSACNGLAACMLTSVVAWAGVAYAREFLVMCAREVVRCGCNLPVWLKPHSGLC